jgi:hypothetical protein
MKRTNGRKHKIGIDDLPAKLQAALNAVAEALDELSRAQWEALCDEEFRLMEQDYRMIQKYGFPNAASPDHALGSLIMGLLAHAEVR